MKDERLLILNEKFHFSGFRKWQEEIIDTLLKRRDAVVVMPTGSGKSLSEWGQIFIIDFSFNLFRRKLYSSYLLTSYVKNKDLTP